MSTQPASNKFKKRNYKSKKGSWGSLSRSERYEAATKEVIELMEEEGAFWLKPWDSGNMDGYGGMFNPIGPYFNAVSGREYRGFNVYALMARCLRRNFSDVRFLTWNQIKNLGGRVKSDEAKKYAFVTYWRFFEKRTEKKDEGGQPTGEWEVITIPTLGAHRLYNIEQTEGLDPAKLKDSPIRPTLRQRVYENIEETTPSERLWAAAFFIKSTGADIRFGDPRACYNFMFDHVRMPNVGDFWNGSAFMATAFHELVHWTGNKSRCDRKFGIIKGDKDYAREELVAELGSAILCAEFGIEGALQHPEYLNNWMSRIKDEPQVLLLAANHAQKAVAFLVELAEKNGHSFALPSGDEDSYEESEDTAAEAA